MNNEPELKVRKQRYDQNFKRSAVELWLGSGKSAETVAAELGISGQTLKVWKQQLALCRCPWARRPAPWKPWRPRIAACGASCSSRCVSGRF